MLICVQTMVTAPLGPGTQPRTPGVQSVLLHRAGPPVAAWPTMSIRKPAGVRQG